MKAYAGKVLMLVENQFPQDIRVWNEATKLRDAGYLVSVICLRTSEQALSENVEGIHVYRLPILTVFTKTKRHQGNLLKKIGSVLQSTMGYFCEYFYFTAACFVISVYVLMRRGFDVVHTHNPPDTLFLIGGFYRLFGKKYVFDHHDLSPELYVSRFGAKPDGVYRILLAMEKCSERIANVVIATNESYREIECKRGGISPSKVFVVRNGPDLDRLHPVAEEPSLKEDGRALLVYLGALNPQDGVDYMLRALHHLVTVLKRRDFSCIVIGSGDSLPGLRSLCRELALDEFVRFTGYIPDEELRSILSAADICLDPDPSSPLNDVSTWIKIMEYMAMAKPIVTFDLRETRYSAQEAAIYCTPNDEVEFAEAIARLLDDPEARERMGAIGRKRVEDSLQWSIVSRNLLQAYESLDL